MNPCTKCKSMNTELCDCSNHYFNGVYGHSYFLNKGTLCACPTNSDGTPDYESVLNVDEFVEPLTEDEKQDIINELIMSGNTEYQLCDFVL